MKGSQSDIKCFFFFFSEKINNLPQYAVQVHILCSGIFSLESDFEQGKEKHSRKHERPEI